MPETTIRPFADWLQDLSGVKPSTLSGHGASASLIDNHQGDNMRLDIDKVTLLEGAHDKPADGLCVMEAVAYIAREKHSDHPECVSPVIATFLRSWNDALDTETRQQLKALIPVVMDTAGSPEDEDRRAWMCLDWLVREYTPAWLRLAKLDKQADLLANLPRFKAGMDIPSIRPAIEAVRQDADAAWDAAWAAAGDAAGAAAWAAAKKKLEPTKIALQASALELLDKMIEAKE